MYVCVLHKAIEVSTVRSRPDCAWEHPACTSTPQIDRPAAGGPGRPTVRPDRPCCSDIWPPPPPNSYVPSAVLVSGLRSTRPAGHPQRLRAHMTTYMRVRKRERDARRSRTQDTVRDARRSRTQDTVGTLRSGQQKVRTYVRGHAWRIGAYSAPAHASQRVGEVARSLKASCKPTTH
jgi:hypothetical protein